MSTSCWQRVSDRSDSSGDEQTTSFLQVCNTKEDDEDSGSEEELANSIRYRGTAPVPVSVDQIRQQEKQPKEDSVQSDDDHSMSDADMITEMDWHEDVWSWAVMAMNKACADSDEKSCGVTYTTIMHAFLGVTITGLIQFFIGWVVMHKYISMDRSFWANLKDVFGNINDNLQNPGFRQLAIEDAQQYCGSYSDNYDIDSDNLKIQQNFSYQNMPGNWLLQTLAASDRSVLENQIVVMPWATPYSSLFLVLLFLASIQAFGELVELRQFGTASMYGYLWQEDEDDYEPLRLPARVLGIYIAIMRFAIVTMTVLAAFEMFVATYDQIDLVMNSLGLSFIFGVDEILYDALLQGALKKLMDGKTLKIKAMPWNIPCITRFCKHARIQTLVVVGLSFLIAGWVRWIQVDRSRQIFSVVGSMCVFFGADPDSTKAWSGVFPATGLCESLHGRTCSLPPSWQEDRCLVRTVNEGSPCYGYGQPLIKCEKADASWLVNRIHPRFFSLSAGVLRDLGTYRGVEELNRICDKMWRWPPPAVVVTHERFEWLNDYPQHPHAPLDYMNYTNKLDLFPRMRDLDENAKLFAAPYACNFEAASKVIDASSAMLQCVIDHIASRSAWIGVDWRTAKSKGCYNWPTWKELDNCSAAPVKTTLRGFSGDSCIYHSQCAKGFCSKAGKCDSSKCSAKCFRCHAGMNDTCGVLCKKTWQPCIRRSKPLVVHPFWNTSLHVVTGKWFFYNWDTNVSQFNWPNVTPLITDVRCGHGVSQPGLMTSTDCGRRCLQSHNCSFVSFKIFKQVSRLGISAFSPEVGNCSLSRLCEKSQQVTDPGTRVFKVRSCGPEFSVKIPGGGMLGVPQMCRHRRFHQICAHDFGDNSGGADIICKLVGFTGGRLAHTAVVSTQPSVYLRKCSSTKNLNLSSCSDGSYTPGDLTVPACQVGQPIIAIDCSPLSSKIHFRAATNHTSTGLVQGAGIVSIEAHDVSVNRATKHPKIVDGDVFRHVTNSSGISDAYFIAKWSDGTLLMRCTSSDQFWSTASGNDLLLGYAVPASRNDGAPCTWQMQVDGEIVVSWPSGLDEKFELAERCPIVQSRHWLDKLGLVSGRCFAASRDCVIPVSGVVSIISAAHLGDDSVLIDGVKYVGWLRKKPVGVHVKKMIVWLDGQPHAKNDHTFFLPLRYMCLSVPRDIAQFTQVFNFFTWSPELTKEDLGKCRWVCDVPDRLRPKKTNDANLFACGTCLGSGCIKRDGDLLENRIYESAGHCYWTAKAPQQCMKRRGNVCIDKRSTWQCLVNGKYTTGCLTNRYIKSGPCASYAHSCSDMLEHRERTARELLKGTMPYCYISNPPEAKRKYSSVDFAFPELNDQSMQIQLDSSKLDRISDDHPLNNGLDFGGTTIPAFMRTWRPAKDAVGQWIEMDIGRPHQTVTGVVIKGSVDGHVTQFTVQVREFPFLGWTALSQNFTVNPPKNIPWHLQEFAMDPILKIPPPAYDVQEFRFPKVKAKYVRIVVQAWHIHIIMRAAVIVCNDVADMPSVSGGKDCPQSGANKSIQDCLNGNKMYTNLTVAVTECAALAECAAVSEMSTESCSTSSRGGRVCSSSGAQYFLRRYSDPDCNRSECKRLMFLNGVFERRYYSRFLSHWTTTTSTTTFQINLCRIPLGLELDEERCPSKSKEHFAMTLDVCKKRMREEKGNVLLFGTDGLSCEIKNCSNSLSWKPYGTSYKFSGQLYSSLCDATKAPMSVALLFEEYRNCSYRVRISGSPYDGVYTRDLMSTSIAPLYKSDKGHYLYYYQSEGKGNWRVNIKAPNSRFCEMWGDTVGVPCPENVQLWDVWTSSTGWTYHSSGVRVEAYPRQCAPKLWVSSPGKFAAYLGMFTRIGVDPTGRPIYRNRDMYYLFFELTEQRRFQQRWTISKIRNGSESAWISSKLRHGSRSAWIIPQLRRALHLSQKILSRRGLYAFSHSAAQCPDEASAWKTATPKQDKDAAHVISLMTIDTAVCPHAINFNWFASYGAFVSDRPVSHEETTAMFDHRPVYWTASGDVVMYYWARRNMWVIARSPPFGQRGIRIDGTGGLALSRSNVLCPSLATGWERWTTDQWSKLTWSSQSHPFFAVQKTQHLCTGPCAVATTVDTFPAKTVVYQRDVACDETYKGPNGIQYRGCQTQTRSGRTCQRWDSQEYHKHPLITPLLYPDAGLDRNYCRNPGGWQTIWCYTTDRDKRWEYCEHQLTCLEDKVTYRPVLDMSKPYTMEKTVKACQKLCQLTEHCAKFSYWQGRCSLHGRSAKATTSTPEHVGGPRECPTTCPLSHPFPYYTGNSYCCKTNKEKTSVPVIQAYGRGCDGSRFGEDGVQSMCCYEDQYEKCKTPPCSSNQICSNQVRVIQRRSHKRVAASDPFVGIYTQQVGMIVGGLPVYTAYGNRTMYMSWFDDDEDDDIHGGWILSPFIPALSQQWKDSNFMHSVRSMACPDQLDWQNPYKVVVHTTEGGLGTRTDWDVVRGQCTVGWNGSCVLSPGYPGYYPNSGECEILAPGVMNVSALDFSTEDRRDNLTVNGVAYSGKLNRELLSVKVTAPIFWTSDSGTPNQSTTTGVGWRICKSSTWMVDKGGCKVEGECVRSPTDGHHRTRRRYCKIIAPMGVRIYSKFFRTAVSDKLIVDGYVYDGHLGPDNVVFNASNRIITWKGTKSWSEWMLCKVFEERVAVAHLCAYRVQVSGAKSKDPSYMGEYFQTGLHRNGRPVYKSSTGRFMFYRRIYWKHGEVNYHWNIGMNLNHWAFQQWKGSRRHTTAKNCPDDVVNWGYMESDDAWQELEKSFTVVASDCDQVRVSDSQPPQNKWNGIYTHAESFPSGKPSAFERDGVTISVDADHYWNIDYKPPRTGRVGYHSARQSSQRNLACPGNATWYQKKDSEIGWKRDPMTTTKITLCDYSVKVFGAESTHPTYMGIYDRLANLSSNDHPIYQNAHGIRLEYEYPYWNIGDEFHNWRFGLPCPIDATWMIRTRRSDGSSFFKYCGVRVVHTCARVNMIARSKSISFDRADAYVYGDRPMFAAHNKDESLYIFYSSGHWNIGAAQRASLRTPFKLISAVQSGATTSSCPIGLAWSKSIQVVDAYIKFEQTCGGNARGAPCQFPFIYRGASYNHCINQDHSRLWCYTDVDGKWGYCNCPANKAYCDESLHHTHDYSWGRNYRGCEAKTKFGIPCENWISATKSSVMSSQILNAGIGAGDRNYCRNPGRSKGGIWCFRNSSGNAIYQLCEPPSYLGTKPTCGLSARGAPCQFPSITWNIYQRTSDLIDTMTKRPYCYTSNGRAGFTDCQIPCDESLTGTDGSRYRGCQTKTRHDRTCQSWSDQFPHQHSFAVPADFPKYGLVENYCRNPTALPRNTIWCYTTDPEKQWEYCDPLPPVFYKFIQGRSSYGRRMHSEITTVDQAKLKCSQIYGCKGISYKGVENTQSPVKIYFMDDVAMSDKDAQKREWSTYAQCTKHSKIPYCKGGTRRGGWFGGRRQLKAKYGANTSVEESEAEAKEAGGDSDLKGKVTVMAAQLQEQALHMKRLESQIAGLLALKKEHAADNFTVQV